MDRVKEAERPEIIKPGMDLDWAYGKVWKPRASQAISLKHNNFWVQKSEVLAHFFPQNLQRSFEILNTI